MEAVQSMAKMSFSVADDSEGYGYYDDVDSHEASSSLSSYLD